jgi:hypothetical protein
MENIGDGESVRKTGVPNTAEPSQPSQTNGKRSTKPTKQRTTPEEAAGLLTSALSYCLEAGLIVTGYNEGRALALYIDGFQYEDGKIRVTPVAEVGVTASVTSVTSVTEGVAVE